MSDSMNTGQPHQPIRLAACTLNQTALDLGGNSSRIAAALDAARQAGASVVCLPELCLTGYGCEDMFLSSGFVVESLKWLKRILPATRALVTCVGLPVQFENHVYNCAAVLVDGKLAAMVPKQHLARDGLHYEPRWFRPWIPENVASIDFDGEKVPFGDLLIEVDRLRIGFEICEDAWVDNRPLHRLANRGANLILNPSASHFAFGKNRVRQNLVLEAVKQYPVAYVYANLLGNEAGRAIYDGDSYIAWEGAVRVAGNRFSFRDHQLIVGDYVSQPGVERTDDFVLKVASNHSESVFVRSGLRQPELPELPEQGLQSWEASDSIKEEEFARAVSLGLFDYTRKSRSNGVVISLSGGADSSAVACLSRLMLDLATEDIGIESVKDRFAHVPELQTAKSVDELAAILICTAYQGTRNSSETTRQAAQDVAHGIKACHLEMDVDQIVTAYSSLISEALGRELNWETDDIALQNIQARSRSPGIWMIANLRNGLLLSTSNRSEAAVGYATMDGDTSGGLAPIVGIDKAFLRAWLRWLESDGVDGFRPFEFLQAVNRQQPTAELRPPDQHQTDEEDLMPYPVLDMIERAAVRDKLMPGEIVQRLVRELPDQNRDQIVFWVRRFFQLWCRNQWKRERYAPGFHLDDESLDPKTWCRFPILSGGFRQELDALDAEKE